MIEFVLFAAVYAVLLFAVLFQTWGAYIAIMALRRQWMRLDRFQKFVSYFIFVPGLVLDIALNMLSSVYYLDPPREWLFTARMKRYRRGLFGKWRLRSATRVCLRWLNPFDPDHC